MKPGVNKVILALVVVVFGVLLAWKATSGGTIAEPSVDEGTSSLTSIHNDAVGDFEVARETGKPVYVLFHSLTCEPCIEISAVADKVVPEYEDAVVFVNVITDDPSGQKLAEQFSFQYIPTSFFIGPDGQIEDSYTGAMDAVAMRARLDALVAGQ